jgi:ATP-dependent DNA ligase
VARSRSSGPGFAARATDKPPAGPGWVGFRIIARSAGEIVRLFSRRGSDLTTRFPAAVAAIATPKARSFVIDGEAIAVDENGLAVFEPLRSRPTTTSPALRIRSPRARRREFDQRTYRVF